jgi:microcystin-dependent protein
MSYQRAQRRAVNRQVLLDNRLSTLTNAHNYDGDLHIERNATIGGNLDVSGDLHARSYYASGNFYLNNYILIPAGTIIQSAASAVPGGWLDCDGQTLSKVIYAHLFSAIGYTYSVGVYSGSDLSFNIPDMRGRVGIGAGTGPGTGDNLGPNAPLTARSLGAKSGVETHALNEGEMPTHSHGSNAIGSISGNANSIGLLKADGGTTITSNVDLNTAGTEPNLSTTVALTISNTGSGLPHNNMQPFLVIRYLIKY